jgi:hypothetical protein
MKDSGRPGLCWIFKISEKRGASDERQEKLHCLSLLPGTP